MAVNIVWFKRDLRLTDHAALQLASQLPEPTLLVYLIEPSLLRNPHYRGRHWQFIGQSLEDLQHAVQVTGHRIAVLEGDAVEVFGEVHRRLGVKRLLSYEETGLEVTFKRDQALSKFCQAAGIEWREFQTNGVERGRRDRKGWNRSWHRVMSGEIQPVDLASVKPISAAASEQLDALRSKRYRQWIKHRGDMQAGGPTQAEQVLKSFLTDRGWGYQKFISKPEQSRAHCSRLSPYLAWGNLSMRQAYQALMQQEKKQGWGEQ